MRISRVVNNNYAIYESRGDGFDFGDTLCMNGQTIYSCYNGN